MNTGGDAAEQIVRLSLEGFEVAAKLTGSAAKEVAILLASALREEQKTMGKARLTSMIRSGKELKVFSIPNKDLKKFTEHAKEYGVLYCVLRNKYNKDDNIPVDIIARAEDASKIQRICDRFALGGTVDKASIVADAERKVAEREAAAKEVPAKTKGELMVEEAVGKPSQKEGNAYANPSAAKTDKNPPSRQNSVEADTHTDKGIAKPPEQRPSVREKLNRYKAQAAKQKEAERIEPEKPKDRPKDPMHNQTVHRQPKKKKKSKER